MMNFILKTFMLISVGLLLGATGVSASHNTALVSGRILLDVEQNGEAWYVLPTRYERVFLGRPEDAFRIMRELGLGIRTQELSGIPPALLPISGEDGDGDGLADSFEEALGINPNLNDTDGDGFDDKTEIERQYSPVGTARLVVNRTLVNRLKGNILLQVEGLGQAWYIHPVDGKRYYLGRPADAFRVMRELSLGITHKNLTHIPERGSGAQQESAAQIKEEPPVRIDITGKEYSFTPFSSRIEAGRPLHISFKNAGTMPHNLYILERGVGTPTIAPGETALLDVNPLDPGIYTFYCSIAGHRQKGMEAFIRAL